MDNIFHTIHLCNDKFLIRTFFDVVRNIFSFTYFNISPKNNKV